MSFFDIEIRFVQTDRSTLFNLPIVRFGQAVLKTNLYETNLGREIFRNISDQKRRKITLYWIKYKS